MITEAEKRIKDAIANALREKLTNAECDVGDLLTLLEMVHATRAPLKAERSSFKILPIEGPQI